MTDRVNGFTVVLESDIRLDDVEPIMNAMKQIKGVAAVTPHISTIDNHIAITRARIEFAQRLEGVIRELINPE